MAKPKDVDEYLARLEGHFAQPILRRVRALILSTAPQVEEKIKWGAPSFEYKGLMMSMVAFKNHVAVWFHKGALFNDPKKLLEASSGETKSMRKYQIANMQELDEEGFRGLVLEAVQKNESGEKVENLGRRSDKYDHSALLEQALEENQRARETYDSLSNYKKREYVEHIETAKQQATKERRLKKALELLEQGLGLNDRYRS